MIQFPSSNTYTASTSTSSSNASVRNSATDAAAKTSSVDKAATPEKSSGLTLGERQDAATTASNILGFVARGIDALRSSGADEERLNQRLEAARAGIEKGYQQASDQLEALGLMDDALEADIQNSRSQVDMALADLGSLKAFAAGDSSNTTQANTSVSQQASRMEQLSFEVLTRDGDRVTVSFNSQQEMSQSGSNGRYSFSAFEDKQFDFSVNGQLDDAELGALNDLFKQVNSLSSQFFDGDLGAALQQAMDIGYDATELASFSLNLYQSSQIQTSVSQHQGYPITQAQLPTPELESLKAPLMNYVDSFLSALEKTSPFADGLKLLDDMVEQLMSARSDTESGLSNESQPALASFSAFNLGLAQSAGKA